LSVLAVYDLHRQRNPQIVLEAIQELSIDGISYVIDIPQAEQPDRLQVAVPS
jgi:hypothetical protein